MADEKEKKKVLTREDLQVLIKDIVENQVLTAKDYIRLGDLKALVKSELEAYVTAELKPAFEAEIKRLEKLPGPGKLNTASDDALKGLAPTGGYSCLAEFAKDVQLACPQAASRPSGRFLKWQNDVVAFNETLKAGTPTLEVSDPEQGGYLIPPEFSNQLLSNAIEQSNFINLCTKVPMQRNSIGIPYIKDFDHTTYVNGAMMAYWLDELGTKLPTKPKFGKIELKLNKMAILVYASDEMLEDSPISMEPLLGKLSEQTFAWKFDEAILAGTGVGQPLGILNSPRVTQAKESGQAAATIVAQNVINMWSRMYPRSKANARWVIGGDLWPQFIVMAIPIGTGGSLALLPMNQPLAANGTINLFGKPVIESEHMRALGTEGDILLADFSQYLIGQKQGVGSGVQFAKSIHLMFLYDQTAFRYVIRMDGQSWWPSTFQPKGSKPTQSPFVTLAVRA